MIVRRSLAPTPGSVGAQPADADLTTIAALDSATAGALATDGSGWIRKTYAQLKTALTLTSSDVGLGNVTNNAQVIKLTLTAVKTSNYTAAAHEFVPIDTTSGNVTVTFPTAPADGTRVGIKHVVRGSTNVITVALGGSDVFNVSGGATSGTITLLNQATIFQYKSSDAIWYATGDDMPLSQLDLRFQPLDSDLTAIAGLTATTDNLVQSVGSAWASRTPAQVKTALALNNVDNTSDANAGISTATQTALDAKLASSSTSAPAVVVPPWAVISPTAASAWYTANLATLLRFTLPLPGTYRWVNLRVGVQSGNIQVGVVSLSRSGTTVTATRAMNSGVIACPAINDQRVDCGATALSAGDYALFLWCDNTTAQFMHGSITGGSAARLAFTPSAGALVSGIDSSAFTLTTTSRWVSGLTLETHS